MTDTGPRRTQAETRRSKWPGWIWAVPIAAVGVTGWLGVRALARGAESVVVSFDSAYGMKEGGDTLVRFRGVKVGEVSDIALEPDGHGVKVKLKLYRKVKKYLRKGTRFWLVGAKFSFSDLSSLKALVSGPEIDMEPGSGPPADTFTGLDQPPALTRQTPGMAFILTAATLGSLDEGSPIYYAGKEVGKITDARLAGPHRFVFSAFVDAPYDRLVSTATRFWDASGVQIAAKNTGVKAQLLSPEALLAGAVAFDTWDSASGASPAEPGEHFELYGNEDQAKDVPVGPQLAYRIRFDGAVGDLSNGAAVMLRGFRVGEVTGFALAYDARAGALNTQVSIELEPQRLDIEGAPPPVDGDWRPIVDAMLRRLIGQGLRARLTQSPPLIGGREVTLAFVSGAHPARLITRASMEQIPSASSGDIASITAKADDVMTKIDAIPIEQIGANVRRITAHIDALASSPKLTASLNDLSSTLKQVDQTVHQIAPQIGPLVRELRRTADEADSAVAAASKLIGGDSTSQDDDLPSTLQELTDTARSIRALADELERHPESLLKGKPKEAP